ncbi:MAG TPA: hypothetical protein ENJ60_01975 [Aeromonadales bacterium]|nr:hypothetical protein [Aeromonadales bacterium]
MPLQFKFPFTNKESQSKNKKFKVVLITVTGSDAKSSTDKSNVNLIKDKSYDWEKIASYDLAIRDNVENAKDKERKINKSKNVLSQKTPTLIQPHQNRTNNLLINESGGIEVKYTLDDIVEQQSTDIDLVVFDPRLRNSLKGLKERKKAVNLFKKEEEFRKGNSFFEFQRVGDQKTVRVNGNCFVVPDYKPFSLTQNIWTMAGTCIKRKRLKLFVRKNKIVKTGAQ